MASPPHADLGSRAPSREFVHALRSHLALVIGLIELMLEDADPNDPRRMDLLEAQEAASEAVKLVTTEYNAEGPEYPGTVVHH